MQRKSFHLIENNRDYELLRWGDYHRSDLLSPSALLLLLWMIICITNWEFQLIYDALIYEKLMHVLFLFNDSWNKVMKD